MMRLCCPSCGTVTPPLPLSGRVPVSCSRCGADMAPLDEQPDDADSPLTKTIRDLQELYAAGDSDEPAAAAPESVPAASGGPCVCDHPAALHRLASDPDDDSYSAYECQALNCDCLSYLDATAHDPEPPDADPAMLDDGDPIEVFAFANWQPGLFHRDHQGAAYVEIDMRDGPISLRADNAIVQRIRRRWNA